MSSGSGETTLCHNLLPPAWTVDLLAVLDENMMLSVVAGEGVVDGRVFPEWHSHTLTV